MKIKTFFHKTYIEVLPSICIWYEKNNKGMAVSWLFWSLEIRND